MILNYSPVVNVCCCHSGSRKDTRLWKDLEKQLAPLIHSQQMTLWHSGDIKAGQAPRQEIKLHIASADVILLLISSDFFFRGGITHGLEVIALSSHSWMDARMR